MYSLRRSILGISLLGTLLTPDPAHGDAPRAASAPSLPNVRAGGRGGARLRMSLRHSDDASVIRVEGLDLTLPERPESILGDTIELGDRAVALLRATGGGRTWAWLLARPGAKAQLLWSGELSAHGDPGERLAASVSTDDRDGDGAPDVLVGLTHERTRLCGAPSLPLIARRALDRHAMRMRPVLLPRALEATQEVAATTAGTPLPAEPLVPMLVPTSASSRAADKHLKGVTPEQRVALAGPPQSLTDGVDTTGWSDGVGRGGRGEFVTLRWAAPRFKLQALAIVTTTPDAPTAFARPKAFWLLTGDQRVRVTVPKDPAEHPGEPLWVHLPKALETDCISIVLDESFPSADGKAGTALFELRGFSTLDGNDGLATLISELGAGRSDAARLLAAIGPAARTPLMAAFPDMSESAQRRAVEVLASLSRATPDALRDLRAAHDSRFAEVRAATEKTLLDLGAPGASALAGAISGPHGDAAALALARAGRIEGVEPTLEALATAEGPAHPGLRGALSTAIARAPQALSVVQTWATSPRPVHAVAHVVLALSENDAARPYATQLVQTYAPHAETFADRYRYVQASAPLSREGAIDAWLADLARAAEEWMLRAEALDALSQRDAPQVPEVARARLMDPIPRVRISAIHALARRGLEQERILKHARQDKWFHVRTAAIAAVPDSQDTRAVVRERIRDHLSPVREVAIKRAAALSDRGAWKLVKDRMESANEYPSVVSSGIAFARKLCIEDAAPVLEKLFEAGMGPGSSETDKELGIEALHALAALGGERARRMVETFAAIGQASPGLQEAAKQAVSNPVRCPQVGTEEAAAMP